MLYDYIITQFYPMVPWLWFINLIIIMASIGIYFIAMPRSYSWNKPEDKESYIKKWKSKLIILCGTQVFIILFYLWLPDVEYVKHFYGEVRVKELTAQQKAELQAQYDKHYTRSERLFIECLKNGQKQPHTTTFNDTNEVVKTCYKVAQYKF